MSGGSAVDFGDLFEKDVNPGIAFFARYCKELAGDDTLPRRSRFRPSKVSPVVSYVFLIDVLPEEGDYRYSLVGDGMILLCGVDPTGKRVNAIEDDTLRNCLRRSYDLVVASRQPVYRRGQFCWSGNSVGIARLLVPMVDDDGRLTTIAGIGMPDTPDEPILVFTNRGVPSLVIDPETA